MGPFLRLASFLAQLLFPNFVTRKKALPPPKVLHLYVHWFHYYLELCFSGFNHYEDNFCFSGGLRRVTYIMACNPESNTSNKILIAK